MLYVLIEEFNTTPLYCVDERVYKKIRGRFTDLFGSELAAEMFLKTFWHLTLRQLSCANSINIMDCFTLLA